MIHLDYETFSRADLKNVGQYRYAVDPSAEILLAAVAQDDEEPEIWVPPAFLDLYGDDDMVASHNRALEIMAQWQDGTTPVYAHNAPFEAAVSKYRLWRDVGIAPPALTQWRCTAAMARRAALPPKLEKVAAVLKLGQQKDTRGAALIRMFSCPQKDGPRIMPWDEPEAFLEFIQYCLQDVRTERDVHGKLSAFELRGEALRTFQLDMAINDRGLPVNVSALRNARVLVDEAQEELGRRFTELTGLSYTQREKTFLWLQERGYPQPNMQSALVTEALRDKSWGDAVAHEALQIRSEVSYAAAGKVKTMLDCECGDGRVRGTLQYHGAGTGRWSGRLIQPQNFKRPTFSKEATAQAYEMICNGCTREELELLYGKALEVISSCIRHFIQLPDGQYMNDADYAAIEARIVCWLGDQDDAIQRFRKGVDSYIDMASFIFSKPEAQISKDERWLGKQTVLGCGFQMGPKKFYDQAYELSLAFNIQGVTVTPELAEKAVGAFRTKYNKVRDLWGSCDRAARLAIKTPGKVFKAGSRISFVTTQSKGIPFLVMTLPSKRKIVYPWPRLEKDKDRVAITFYGQIPGKQSWGRIKTYGGKLVENATQGTAADIMAHGACKAEEQGFQILTLIHDEAISEHDGRPVQEFCDALTDLPGWADGLPVNAEGEVIPYYTKT